MLHLTLPWIWSHPLTRRQRLAAYGRYGWWQIRSRLRADPFVMPWVNGTSLLLAAQMQGATGNLYCGLHEWPDMAFVLHLLRPGDAFADIGANVGTYTILASGAVGCHSEVFEPVPDTYRQLSAQIDLNRIADKVALHQRAVGDSQGSLRFSIDSGAMNRVVDSGYPGRTAIVPVVSIDSQPALRHCCCWKLDVEGHEPALLRGAAFTLQQAPPAALLCEDNSPVVAATLHAAGYQICTYDPWSRQLNPATVSSGINQIWVRDLAWVRQRLLTAPPFQILGLSL